MIFVKGESIVAEYRLNHSPEPASKSLAFCLQRTVTLLKEWKKVRKKPIWLLVEPTHLKNMIVKMGSSSPRFGVNIYKIFETTT